MSRKAPKRKGLVDNLDKLNVRQDLFCHFYVQNNDLRGNATWCYAAAYNYNLDAAPRDNAVWEEDAEGNKVKILVPSSYSKIENICGVEGNRLLRSPKIQDRINELYRSLLRDDVIDTELSKLINQNEDRGAKMAAIREANKLKGRIIDKKMLTDAEGKAIPILGLTVHVPGTST